LFTKCEQLPQTLQMEIWFVGEGTEEGGQIPQTQHCAKATGGFDCFA